MLNQTPRSWAGRATVAVSTGAIVLCAAATASAQEKKAEDKKWYDPIALDLNLGVPTASSQELRFVGDGMAGYVLPSFGLIARGSTILYDLNTDTLKTDTTRGEATVEGWFYTGSPGDAFRLQIGTEGGGASYDTTYSPVVSTAGRFHDEDSWMVRGNLLIGADLQASQVHASLVLGGGFQWESYDYLTTDPKDPNLFSSTTDTSARGLARMQVRWRFLPDTLSTRLRGEGTYFQLTRESLFVTNAASNNAVGTAENRIHQLELKARLSVEVDALALIGIVPYVFGGLDYIGVSNDTNSTSATIPSVGAGLFKPVWY